MRRFIHILTLIFVLNAMAHPQPFSSFLLALRETSDSLKKKDLVDAYLEQRSIPLVEGDSVYFLYRGKGKVVAVPGEMNGWSPHDAQMERIPMTDLFYRTCVLPYDARVEYKIWVDSTWMLDPFNPRKARGGHGENSDLWMPGYVEPTEIQFKPDITRGTIEMLWVSSKHLKRKHPLLIYLPPEYSSRERYPVLYVTDGEEYLSLGKMKNVLDNLIAQKRIVPVVGVFVDPRTDLNDPSTNKRMVDYAASEAFCNFMEREVAPTVEQHFSVSRAPKQRVIMGASMGGLIATYIVLTRPRFIPNGAAQSPAYFQADSAVIKTLKNMRKTRVNIYMDTGILYDTQREARLVRDLLQSKGANVFYREYPEGHNWSNWRARIGTILEYFYPHR